MKKLIYLTLTPFLFISCEKPDHKIRVKNNYTHIITSLAVGDAIFDNVKIGNTTEYKSINKGSFSIDGRTSSEIITGTGKIRGRGKHNWTLTFDESGHTNIKEDL